MKFLADSTEASPTCGQIIVNVAWSDPDKPHRAWPALDDRLRVRRVNPPYDALRHGPCDVVVLRCRDPFRDLPQLRATLGKRTPPVLLACPGANAEQVTAALDLGVASYLVEGRNFSGLRLSSAIVSTAMGHTCLCPAATAALMERAARTALTRAEDHATPRQALTPREREVMDMLASGVTVAEIGQQLSLSRKTVRNYVSSIYAKLGVSSRTAAVLVWLGVNT